LDHEACFGAGVAGGIDPFVMPLDEALGVGEGPFLLRADRGGEEEDLGLDVARAEFAFAHFGRVVPEGGGLDLVHVADDEPVELAERAAGQFRVLPADGRVLPHAEEAFHEAVAHRGDHPLEGVVVVDFWQQAVGVVVVGGGGVAVPGFQQADHIGRDVVPDAGWQALAVEVGVERGVAVGGGGHREVAGEQVVEGGDVGAPLDAGVAAQREDAAARSADVAEEELQDGASADRLRAGGVLGPGDGVGEGGGAVRAGVG
jgi:hypothetical protein